ncbi:MAG TPA: HAMP domain-containing sensor histidine kinase, partial [Spirochaetota bacterium]|nr:HAMP domain-containing sensor histidine kinase [Spirochaetota bacterium]
MTNIILANGADVRTSRVDAAELFSSLRNYADNELVYAEAVFLPSKNGMKGDVLAKYSILRGEVPSEMFHGVSSGNIARMKQPWKWNGETEIPGENGRFFEFIAAGSVSGKPVCLVRVLFSKEKVLAPVIEMRRITGYIVAVAVLFVVFLGFILSRQISKPIMRLTEAAMKMDGGDFDISVPVNSRDEVGKLSRTFNHMLRLINLKIAELEESNKKLRELDAMKDEFLANTSHELKTPLYGIVGIAESLMRGASGPLNDETRENIRMIVSSGKTLGNLVNDILDFSRMKHFDLDLRFQRIDIYDVAQFVLSVTIPLAGNRNIVIENDIEPDTMIVRGDDGRLQQILLNLVGNAVKFTERGFVRISAGRSDDGSVVVNVSDSGIGIPDEMREQ